jgi:quercetin dioxygenase-like cupin family protein
LALERHIEVKGRAKGQETITVTANEIRHGLNQKDKFVLAVVVVDGESGRVGQLHSHAVHPRARLGRGQQEFGLGHAA